MMAKLDAQTAAAKLSQKSKTASSEKGKTLAQKMPKQTQEVQNPQSPAKRCPKGWSFRHYTPQKGRKGTCHSCQQTIEYQDNCVRHRVGDGKSKVVRMFHCTTNCMEKLNNEDSASFVNHYWIEGPVLEVIKSIRMKKKQNK